MSKPKLFVSCGQFTESERALGQDICELAAKTDFEPFFAQRVSDLNGLDANVLEALSTCAAMIVVMHPRGMIKPPDEKAFERASVWIEQEIAIATYIQRIEKRPLPIVVFKHRDVGREGLRQFLHINPIEFQYDGEVLAALPSLLAKWKDSAGVGVQLFLKAKKFNQDRGHSIVSITATTFNGSNRRIREYTVQLQLASYLRAHWKAARGGELVGLEVATDDPAFKVFKATELPWGAIQPTESKHLSTMICPTCAYGVIGDFRIINASEVVADLWVDGIHLRTKKLVGDLCDGLLGG